MFKNVFRSTQGMSRDFAEGRAREMELKAELFSPAGLMGWN